MTSMQKATEPLASETKRGLNRRGFLAAAGAAVAGAATLRPTIAQGQTAAPSSFRPVARNLILVVSDGMSMGTLTLADTVCRRFMDRPSHWASVIARPGTRRALMSTHSADSLVTDSAAASSAWACGYKVNNGSLNVLPSGRVKEPLLVTARKAGKAIGLVTTTRLTHATPAGFIADSKSRSAEEALARQMLERGVDVMLGGGRRFLTDALIGEFKSLHVVRDRESLLQTAPGNRRLLGVFDDDHLRYAPDRPPTQPTIAEMTRVALKKLSTAPDGFIVQIEAGGRVDHAAHENDAAALVADQLACDDAIAEVMAFAGERDDTLVLLTSDHGNANPGMTLYRKEADSGLQRLREAKHSFEWIFGKVNAIKDDPAGQYEMLMKLVPETYGIELNDEEKGLLARALHGERVAPFKSLDGKAQVLGGVLANYFGVSFMSGNHTSDHVELTAWGAGADKLPGFVDNTELYRFMLDSCGIAVPG
jgi:alkaline phosphatase